VRSLALGLGCRVGDTPQFEVMEESSHCASGMRRCYLDERSLALGLGYRAGDTPHYHFEQESNRYANEMRM
jgi:hypothetical protein